MAQYVALLYYPGDNYWTSAGERKYSAQYGEFGAAAGAAGVMVSGGALHPVESATTITVAGGAAGGDVVVTDGPYAEAKEVLGGFSVLEAADLDEALAWAARIPAAWRGKVEVRPIFDQGAVPGMADADG